MNIHKALNFLSLSYLNPMVRKKPSLRAGRECPAQPATHPVTVEQTQKVEFQTPDQKHPHHLTQHRNDRHMQGSQRTLQGSLIHVSALYQPFLFMPYSGSNAKSVSALSEEKHCVLAREERTNFNISTSQHLESESLSWD